MYIRSYKKRHIYQSIEAKKLVNIELKWEETQIGVVIVKWLRMRTEKREHTQHTHCDNSIEASFFFHRTAIEIHFVLLSVGDEGNRIEAHQTVCIFSRNGTSEMIFKANKNNNDVG